MKTKDLHLLAHYAAKPRDPAQTKIAGYMQNPANITYDESVEITKGLKDSDRASSQVVLNLRTHAVVKNTFNASATFDEMIKYYCDAYPSYLEQLGFTLEEINAPDNVQPVQTQEKTCSES